LEVWEQTLVKKAMKPRLASLQTLLGMVITGNTLMIPTPPGPGQRAGHRRRGGPDEPCEQVAHFRNSQGKHSRGAGRPRGRRRNGGAPLRCANPGKIGQRQQHERDVPVPADEAAHFVVVQPHVFGVFKILLDMPSGSKSFHHLLQGGSRRSKHKVVALLLR
jgi:hypothetical protein